MVGGWLKALIFVVVLLVDIACGESTASNQTPPIESPASSSLEAASPSPSPMPSLSQSAVAAVVILENAPLTASRGQNATLQAKTSPATSCGIEVRLQVGSIDSSWTCPQDL